MISTKELNKALTKIGARAYNEAGLREFKVATCIYTSEKDVKKGRYALVIVCQFLVTEKENGEEVTNCKSARIKVKLDLDQKYEDAINKILKKFHKGIENTHFVVASEFKNCNRRAKLIAKKVFDFKPSCY
jgi:hypothetical protein